MKYRLILPQKVQKELLRVDSRYRVRVSAAISALTNDPYIGKKLEGEYADQRSYEVWPYRIIYMIKKEALVVLIVKVGHRQGVYY